MNPFTRFHLVHRTGWVLAALVAAAPELDGQWAIELHGGRLQGAPGAEPAASGAFSLLLRRDVRQGGIALGGGIPANRDEALWGSASAWYHLARQAGPVSVGADLAGHGALLNGRDGGYRRVPGFPLSRPVLVPATTASSRGGQVMPLVAFERGAWRIQARAGAGYIHLREGDASVDRTVPQADLQITRFFADFAGLSPAVRRYREPDGAWTDYAGLTGIIAWPGVALSATVGQWFGRGRLSTPWALSATLWPQGRVHLIALARHDSYQPLTRQAALTAWNLGVGLKLGPLLRVPAAPIASRDADGRAVFRLSLTAGGDGPRIAGDFTNWTPVPMQRDGDTWIYATALASGVYQYAFVTADGAWFVPLNTPGRRDDGMGGHVAVLVVQ